ncbi:MAG: hypothetical protein J6Y36_04155 [Treponema sp.]|nr:hypothetical protein [Treponema sp.]
MARFGYSQMKEKYEKLFDYYKNSAGELVKPFCFDDMKRELPDEYDEISGYLMCQLLEFFSKAVRLISEDEYLDSADYIYERVVHEAFDTTFGGYYETLSGEGKVLSERKILETQFMAMVSLAEYACAKKISGDEEYHYTAVLNRALAVYTMLNHYALIKDTKAFYKVMNKDWSPVEGSEDAEVGKTVAEAYRLLYADLAFIDSKATGTLQLISSTVEQLKA